MRNLSLAVLGLAAFIVFSGSALADELSSSRDIESAVDSYLASTDGDAALIGGPGSAGYDNGFWIRGGDYQLRINATLQARFEAFDFDESQPPELGDDQGTGAVAGDLSGFALPRATIKLSGEAPCSTCYYVELEFGHFGRDALEALSRRTGPAPFPALPENLGSNIFQSANYDTLREAWIEWCNCPAFNVRMGQIKTPTTRQMMVAPEHQQFIDISLASSFIGQMMPGYTDRNRDHGLMIHGAFGCDESISYMVTITNGDGADSIRNVLDHRTSDNLQFGARLNWAFMAPIGYVEGALAQKTCGWYGELGAWAVVYDDRSDKPHVQRADDLTYGVDLALGYGGFSFTAAYSVSSIADIANGVGDIDSTAWLVQLGYHFPGTAWEVAVRASQFDVDVDAGVFLPLAGGPPSADTMELAFGVNYYLNGHQNKLQLDVSIFEGGDTGSAMLWDAYAGFPGAATGDDDFGTLIRFQWQLAL